MKNNIKKETYTRFFFFLPLPHDILYSPFLPYEPFVKNIILYSRCLLSTALRAVLTGGGCGVAGEGFDVTCLPPVLPPPPSSTVAAPAAAAAAAAALYRNFFFSSRSRNIDIHIYIYICIEMFIICIMRAREGVLR